MSAKMERAYAAGVWGQEQEAIDGGGLVVWSRHRSQALAVRAARKYARQQQRDGASAGGALSWSGGWRDADGRVRWIDSDGEVSQ